MTRPSPTCLTLLGLTALTACSSDPPDQVLIGTWGIDPVALEDELADAAQHGEMARRMAEARAKLTLAIRAEFDAAGNVEIVGSPIEGKGKYEVLDVTGDTVKVALKLAGQSAAEITFTATDNDHVTMADASKAWALELTRR